MSHATLSYKRANAVREAYASELFNIESVKALIAEAANNGDRLLQIHQEYCFSLTDYPAATTLETWLDDNGYRYVWQVVYVPPDLMHPYSNFEYQELEIRW
jgi:hypothetical protein